MISILCATRHRPESMQRLYDSATQTSSSELEFVWFIDEDDIQSQNKAKELNTKFVVRPRYSITIGEGYNECFKISQQDIIFSGADDIVFKTQDWDKIVYNAFNKHKDKILLCGGYDLCNNLLITHFFQHANWVKVTGKLHPPFRDCYVDTWLNDVAQTIGRLEWLPIVIEHLHPSVNKSQPDQVFQERMAAINKNDESAKRFFELKHQRLEEAQKLHEFILQFSS